MYQYCKDRGVPHANLGKLLVATSPDQVGLQSSFVSKWLARCQKTPIRTLYPQFQQKLALIYVHEVLLEDGTQDSSGRL